MSELKKLHGTENFFTKEYPRERIVTLEEVEMKRRAEKEAADENIIEERPEPQTIVMEEKKKPGPKPKEK